MNKKIKYLFITVALIIWQQASGQQYPLYSQYMFNHFGLNPAYAGTRNAISAVLLSRSQWISMPGAPKTGTLALHSPLGNKKLALGLNIFSENIGPSKNIRSTLAFAYHINVSNKAKLSLALSGGMHSAELDWSQLIYQNMNDAFASTQNAQTVASVFDFGAYYYTNDFFIGFSSTNINKPRIYYLNAPVDMQFYLRRHFFLTSGKNFKTSEKWMLKPSLLLRYMPAAPVNIDLNFIAMYAKKINFGLSYRSSKSIVFISEFNLLESLRMGYAADVNMRFNRQTGLSHEIMLGYDFSLRKTKNISSRYF